MKKVRDLIADEKKKRNDRFSASGFARFLFQMTMGVIFFPSFAYMYVYTLSLIHI